MRGALCAAEAGAVGADGRKAGDGLQAGQRESPLRRAALRQIATHLFPLAIEQPPQVRNPMPAH